MRKRIRLSEALSRPKEPNLNAARKQATHAVCPTHEVRDPWAERNIQLDRIMAKLKHVPRPTISWPSSDVLRSAGGCCALLFFLILVLLVIVQASRHDSEGWPLAQARQSPRFAACGIAASSSWLFGEVYLHCVMPWFCFSESPT